MQLEKGSVQIQSKASAEVHEGGAEHTFSAALLCSFLQ